MIDSDVFIVLSNTVESYHSFLSVKNERINSIENTLGFYPGFDYNLLVNFKFVDFLPKTSLKLVLNLTMLPTHVNIYLDNDVIDYINKTDNVYLWLYSPHESTLDFDLLYEELKKHNVSFDKVVISNSSDRYHLKNVEGIKFTCLYDWWEQYYKFHLRTFKDVSFITPEQRWLTIDTANKKFLSLNRNLKNFRVWFYYKMLEHVVVDQGHVSYHLPDIAGNSDEYKLFLETALKDIDPKLKYSILNTPSIFKVKELDTLNRNMIINYQHTIADYYHDSLVSFTPESLLEENFITEKTFKSITHSHPFIIVGNEKITHRLRLAGYKTFEKLFDLDYVSTVCEADLLLRNVKKMPLETLKHKIKEEFFDDIVHNYKHFYNRKVHFNKILDDVKKVVDFKTS